ncbi:MAG: N-acetylglucosamine-6-phosphate deacetylase [Clostridia bacterium]|nr:N-acetylglucosamine-6-phosphate deacetylase [Clostridia bacterium]
MQAIINGKIVLPDRIVEDAVLLFDAKIEGIVPANELPAAAETIDAAGKYVIPGLIDMHIHGYLGEDASDGSFDGIRTMAEGVAKNGVTSFLPTTMTVSYDELRAAFAQIRKGVEESKYDTWQGAQILGVNAEGPFITPSKKGAQAGENIRPGDADFLKEYLDIIRVFTIAPEMPGNMDCIREMAGKCLISMGHTNATFDEAKAGIEAGVGHVTHLFNAQTALMHRDPGVVGAALTDDRVSTELIADAFHVNANLFPLVAKMKGDKLVLITDCTRAGGLADGEYTLGGQPIFVNGIECRLADGTIAGSVLRLNHAVRNLLKYTSLPVWEAVNAASLNPAKRIGADGVKGSLEKGKDADIVLCDEEFNICRTISRGRTIYSA